MWPKLLTGSYSSNWDWEGMDGDVFISYVLWRRLRLGPGNNARQILPISHTEVRGWLGVLIWLHTSYTRCTYVNVLMPAVREAASSLHV